MGFVLPARSTRATWRSVAPQLAFLWTIFCLGQVPIFGENIIPAGLAPQYRLDQILVQPKHGIGSDTLARFHFQHEIRVLRTLRSEGGLQIVSVPAGQTVTELVKTYQESGLVDFAEPDYLVRTAATIPDDPKFLDGTLWGLTKIGRA